jgi:hypothetical protein
MTPGLDDEFLAAEPVQLNARGTGEFDGDAGSEQDAQRFLDRKYRVVAGICRAYADEGDIQLACLQRRQLGSAGGMADIHAGF